MENNKKILHFLVKKYFFHFFILKIKILQQIKIYFSQFCNKFSNSFFRNFINFPLNQFVISLFKNIHFHTF